MAAPIRQLPLDLGHRPAHGRDDFLIADGNRDAVAWIDLWPQWPAPVLMLCGPAACGKSHLAAVWTERTQAATVTADDLTSKAPDEIFAKGPHLLIDPVDPWIGERVVETVLFHLYNMAMENGKTILMTTRAAPSHLTFTLPDLASRLRAAPLAPITPPDETVLAAIMVKMFADRQLQISQDVLDYILPRMERSFAAARDLIAAADALALAEKKAISIPLVRRILLTDAG